MHSEYDSAESIADSDLEDGERRKMLASPLYLQNREDYESSRMPIATLKPAALVQERGTSSKRAQADLRKGLMSSSSQEPSAPGNLLHCFHLETKKWEINSRVLISETLTRQMWEDLFLRERKIICSVKQKTELVRQEHHVGSLNNCISEQQQHAYAQRLELQDAEHGYIESRREQVRRKGELSVKEKVLRDTQIRSMHEMGEMQRAQELRVDEVSVQKLRENHETIQKLTSLLQEMQEQMNSMNDSGEFQEVESNYSGRLSYVSSQPAMVPSSRSMLSRDKRLPFDTWNTSGLQENVFGKQFSTFDSPRDYSQRIQSDDVQRNREAVPEAGRMKTCHTSEDRQNQGTIPMPTFATKPLTTSSTKQVEIRFKNQVTTCSDFPSDAMLWIKKVEMVDSLDELKSLRSVSGMNVPNFEMLDAKIASALNKIIENSQIKKRSEKPKKKGPVSYEEDRSLS